ncbi:HAD-IIIC family phosphatase [Kitasatospora sp. NPDC057198]|uniref:HAD-IIIC family phosphatase n=1 Tax=Kitasatospora sp. NPDC057198 TaxID=3346046 RepID=UPI00362AB3D7
MTTPPPLPAPVAPPPLERLRRLRAAGELAAAWPRLPALLADLLDEAEPDRRALDLGRAGRVLAGADPDEVLRRHPDTPVLSVAVTGQSTVGGLVDPLTAEFARHGLLVRPVLGDHGGYLRDLADPAGPLLAARPDLVLCLLDAETVFAEVPAVWRVEDAADAARRVLERLAALAAEFARTCPATLVLNTVPLLRAHTHQLIDLRSRARLGVVWREFNAGLLRLAEEHPALVVVDLDPLVADGGPAVDARLAAYAGARLAAPLLAGYAREVGHLARALRGRTRKCLVLDLDGTLWDGVLAEDGPEGVAAAGTLRGEAFGAFQDRARQLAAQGVLLAVSSKNDRERVLETLRGHPDLRLREDDFVRVDADWSDKAAHLSGLEEEFGLVPEALVFADDSPAERARVREGVPGAVVLPLDGEPALHPVRLLADGWFDVPRLTAEDRDRAGQYRAEGERARLRGRSGSLAEFLAGLDVRAEVSPPRPHEYPRLAQLTQRTNRFNLTGRRLDPAEPARLAAAPGRLLLAVRTADRFGANGLVGAVLGGRSADRLLLENVWLSCRVLARGIEQAVLAALLEHAAAAGLRAVEARYRPTARNARAGDFYPGLGFAETGREGELVCYRHDLTGRPAVPGHVRLDLRMEGTGEGRA